ncbi:O141 family O-antigen polymerase [Escherichia coli]|nr:O141 family O-antigen polymerase [Escherichia coli]
MEYMLLCFWLAISCCSVKVSLSKINILLIFIFLSGAYSWGYDWIRYREYYENVFLISDLVTWIYEPGFTFILFVNKLLNLDYHWVVVTCTLILSVNVYKYIKVKNHPNFCLLFVFSIFGFMEFTGQIRQGVAISFILLAVDNLLVKKNKKFIFYVICAAMFHISAIVCLLFLYLVKLLDRKNKAFIMLSLIILGGVSVIAFNVLINNMDFFGVSGFIATKLKGYAESDGSESGILSAGLLLNIMVIVICLLSIQGRHLKYYLSSVFSFFVIQSKIVSIAYRFSYYGYAFIYESFEWLYMANKGRLFNKLAMIIVLLVFAFKPLLNPVYLDMFNDYHFFWFGFLDTLPDVNITQVKRCSTLLNHGIQYCRR